MKDIAPLHFLASLMFGKRAKAQRDKAVHREFQPLIKLSVNAANIEDFGDFAACKGNRFGTLMPIVLP